MKILIDTNIIVDVICKREPFFEVSLSAMRNVLKNDTAIVPASSMTDIYYIIRKSLGSEESKKKLKELISIVKIVETRESDVKKALDSEMKDFEDAVISEIAKRTKCKYILTRNIKDFVNSDVDSILPSDFLSQ